VYAKKKLFEKATNIYLICSDLFCTLFMKINYAFNRFDYLLTVIHLSCMFFRNFSKISIFYSKTCWISRKLCSIIDFAEKC